MQIGATVQSPLTTSQSSSTSPVPGTEDTSKNKDKSKDKDKGIDAAPSPAPAKPALSGTLNMAAVRASQADEREREQAAAEEAETKARTLPTTSRSPDGSDAALRLLQDTVKETETRRIEDQKAAQERRAKASPERSPGDEIVALPDPERDQLRPQSESVSTARPSIGVQSYQAAFGGAVASGTTIDDRV